MTAVSTGGLALCNPTLGDEWWCFSSLPLFSTDSTSARQVIRMLYGFCPRRLRQLTAWLMKDAFCTTASIFESSMLPTNQSYAVSCSPISADRDLVRVPQGSGSVALAAQHGLADANSKANVKVSDVHLLLTILFELAGCMPRFDPSHVSLIFRSTSAASGYIYTLPIPRPLAFSI